MDTIVKSMSAQSRQLITIHLWNIPFDEQALWAWNP